MGIYVYQAYKGLKRREGVVPGENWWEDAVTGEELGSAIFIHEAGPGYQKSTEFQVGEVYEYEHCFAYSLDVGCNGRDWHDVLGAMVNYDMDARASYPPGGPFVEILDPAYSVVMFGPIASAKLVADFDAWDERARSFSDPEFYLAYCAVRTCFSHAAEGGAAEMTWRMD